MEMSLEDVERMHREMRKGIENELHVRTGNWISGDEN